MNAVWAFLIGIAIGLGLVILARRRPTAKAKFFAACEYWVYLPGDQMPDQDKVMTQMVARNPHSQGGQAAIGPKEGILFSDIRLSCTLVLRSKNPHVFRPDIFGDVDIAPELLTALAKSAGLVKLRYISEEPLVDARHLQFMPHLADAYSRLGRALAVFDVVAEKLYTSEGFHGALQQDVDATRPEFHLRVAWKCEGPTAHAETKGMVKKGLSEMISADAMVDNQRLVCEVLQEAATLAWNRGEHLETEIVEYFGDRFEVRAMPEKDRKRVVHIVRYQAV